MALQGSLDTFALPDVLRLLATTAKTGRLRIEGDRGNGSVWLRDGTVMAATADRAVEDAPAEEVIFELLRFEEGAFAFDMDELSPNGEQPEDVEILLRNAGALLSEWNELVAIVPSLDHRVKLVGSLPKGDVTIDSRRWPSLVAVASGRTVRDVSSSLGLSELAATRAVRDLVDLGVAEVEEPSSEDTIPPASRRNDTIPPPSRRRDDTIPPASRRDVPPDELARRTPFSSLGSGESLATSVPRADTDGLPPTEAVPRAGWLQSDEVSGSHGAVPDALTPTSNGGRGQGSTGNGAGPATPPAGTEIPSRRGRSASSRSSSPAGTPGAPDAGTSGSGSGSGSGKRSSSGTGSGRSSRSSASRASGSSRSSSSRAPGSGRSTGSGKRAGRSGAGAASSGTGRDPSGESRRPPTGPGGPGAPNGEGPSRLGKTRPPSSPRRTGGPSRPPVLPDTGPLSMPPVSPTGFESGPLGPPPLPADTGQIRPVSSSALPPDLQWAVEDDAGVPPPPGPFGNGLGNGVGNGVGNGLGNGAGHGVGNGLGGGRGNGAPMGNPPMAPGGPPLDPNKVAPHVAAMSPEARAAVQGTVGNTGGAANGFGPGDELAQRGQLLNFLSSVRP